MAKADTRNEPVLVPRLDWGSWRTWRVFLGIGSLLGTVFIVLLVLASAIAQFMFQQAALQILSTSLLSVLSFWPFYRLLRRAFPLRDTQGERVPGNPPLDWNELPHALEVQLSWGFTWMLGHTALTVTLYPLLGIEFETLRPGWSGVLLMVFAMLAVELPYRILWRAPRQL